jgi:hypothetical protein
MKIKACIGFTSLPARRAAYTHLFFLLYRTCLAGGG